MTPPEILAEARRLNLCLAVEGDGIRVTPAGNLPDSLREAIRACKPELLALLRAHTPQLTSAGDTPPQAASPTPPTAATPAASHPPVASCPICWWPPPGDPKCPRCDLERQRLQRLAGEPVTERCRLCNELPPGRPDCNACKAVRIQALNEAELRAAFGPGGYRRR